MQVADTEKSPAGHQHRAPVLFHMALALSLRDGNVPELVPQQAVKPEFY